MGPSLLSWREGLFPKKRSLFPAPKMAMMIVTLHASQTTKRGFKQAQNRPLANPPLNRRPNPPVRQGAHQCYPS